MQRSFVSILVFFAAAASLTGCSGVHMAGSQPDQNIRLETVRYHPVFIVPNCQQLAGTTHCQWIEQSGVQQPEPEPEPAPAAARAQHVPGIIL